MTKISYLRWRSWKSFHSEFWINGFFWRNKKSLSNSLYVLCVCVCAYVNRKYTHEKNRIAWPVTSDPLHENCLQYSSILLCKCDVCMTREKLQICMFYTYTYIVTLWIFKQFHSMAEYFGNGCEIYRSHDLHERGQNKQYV